MPSPDGVRAVPVSYVLPVASPCLKPIRRAASGQANGTLDDVTAGQFVDSIENSEWSYFVRDHLPAPEENADAEIIYYSVIDLTFWVSWRFTGLLCFGAAVSLILARIFVLSSGWLDWLEWPGGFLAGIGALSAAFAIVSVLFSVIWRISQRRGLAGFYGLRGTATRKERKPHKSESRRLSVVVKGMEFGVDVDTYDEIADGDNLVMYFFSVAGGYIDSKYVQAIIRHRP